jgi:hypothetical protein
VFANPPVAALADLLRIAALLSQSRASSPLLPSRLALLATRRLGSVRICKHALVLCAQQAALTDWECPAPCRSRLRSKWTRATVHFAAFADSGFQRSCLLSTRIHSDVAPYTHASDAHPPALTRRRCFTAPSSVSPKEVACSPTACYNRTSPGPPTDERPQPFPRAHRRCEML